MKIFDTIAAVSTPRGKGGVAMIRISGEQALELASRVFFPKSGKSLSEICHGKAVYGIIKEYDGEGNSFELDDGIATVFLAPKSFTGENTVEICCHGGALITERVLSACLSAGCRQAEAGEFTKRAFISGRMSLSQAEDLGALLDAKTDGQLILSRNGLEGHLTNAIGGCYEEIRSILSSVYAKIDFPDEDLASIDEKTMLLKVKETKEKLVSLEKTYKTGRAVCEGIKTVICGRANGGKSSLYNRILGRDAAIVTDIPGTTRDVLEQTAAMGKVTLLLCDTAGLRETDDKVESIGIERSRAAMESAELIFAVFDSSSPFTEEDEALVCELSGRQGVIAVLNKCDLAGADFEKAKKFTQGIENHVCISAKTGEGYEELVEKVEKIFDLGEIDLRSDALVTNARQHSAILRAVSHLKNAEDALSMGLTVDLCGTDMECAMSCLAEIDGREVTEDIVSNIFAHFCVGK